MPSESLLIGRGLNRYGVPVSQHICGACGTCFTVCPPKTDEWGGCQAEGCHSYDESRDVDKLFDDAPWKISRKEQDDV